MAKTTKEVTTYTSKEVKTTKESTTLGKVAKGAAVVVGITLAIGLLSGGSKK